LLYPGEAIPVSGEVIPNLIVEAVTPGSADCGFSACAGTVVTVRAAIASTAEVVINFRRLILIISFLPSRALAGFFLTSLLLFLYYFFSTTS
jgi:hypothetical protein